MTYGRPPAVSPCFSVATPGAACPGDDQRGAARPRDGDRDGEARCDAGSFELGGPSVVEIPVLGELGLLVLMIVLAWAGVVASRR